MRFIVISSSSKANGYLLETKEEALVIEAGVSLLQIKKALAFNLAKIAGCIVTHRHLDHAMHVKHYADNGINVYGPSDVFTTPHNRCFSVREKKGFRVGGFKIIPFPLHHDVTCFGYLIDHDESSRILFIADTFLCEYAFLNLRHIIIEANYSDNILDNNIFMGIEHPSKRERLLTSHMELKTTIATLKAQDLLNVQNIILIHLSDQNSDEKRFADEIVAETGKVVACAREGLTVDLSVF